MGKFRHLVLLSSFFLSSCFKSAVQGQGSTSRPTYASQPTDLIEITSTKTSGTVKLSTSQTQTMAVSSNSVLAGTSIAVPPGALSISTSIIIEQGADLADTSVTQEVGLNGDVVLTQAGNGVIVRPSVPTVLQSPITLHLPLPVGPALRLSSIYYAVYYKYFDPVKNQLMTGIKLVDNLEAKLVYDEILQRDIVQMDGYFGVYWVVVLNREVAKVELPVAKVSEEAIVNKANASVLASTGIVSEVTVLATQAKPEVQWEKPLLTFSTSNRKASLSAKSIRAALLRRVRPIFLKRSLM